MNVVIIEDEIRIARGLSESIVELRPDAKILEILPSIKKAIPYLEINKDTIDLILADVELEDGLSFEIFEALEVSCPIIFCTAFDQYAIKSFETNGIGYILKPYSIDELEKYLDKYDKLENNLTYIKKILKEFEQRHLVTKSNAQSLLLNKGSSIIPISFESIALAWIEHKRVCILTTDNTRYVYPHTLDHLTQKLGDRFFRVSRQFLIHIDSIRSANHYFSRTLKLELSISAELEVIVPKRKVAQFLEWWSAGA